MENSNQKEIKKHFTQEKEEYKIGQEKNLLPLSDDFVFKRVFAKDGHEEILKDLISAILNIEIKSIEVKNPEMTKPSKEAKQEILDIRAEINNDTYVNIEMQVQDFKDFDKRTVSYLSKMYSDQMEVGSKYKNNLKTIAINILNFNFYKVNSYHFRGKLRIEEKEKAYVNMGYEKEDKYITDDLEIHIIELPKFLKAKPDVNNKLSQWLYLISGKGEQINMAKEINEKVIEAAKILSNVSKSTDDRRLYQARMQKYADIISLYESGLEEGEQARKNKAEWKKDAICKI